MIVILAFTRRISSKAKENIYGTMAPFIKATTAKDSDKEWVNGNQQNRTAIFTSVTFGVIRSREQGSTFGVINVFIRETSLTTSSINYII